MNRFIVDFEDIKISGVKDDTSNSVDRNSVAGRIDNDFNNEQTTEVVNGGPGSGNFGHAGRPGMIGGSAPKDGSSPETVGIYVTGEEAKMDFDTIIKRRDMHQRLKKIRKIGDFNDEIIEEMRKLNFSEQEIEGWRAIILAKDITHIMGKNARQERQARMKYSPE